MMYKSQLHEYAQKAGLMHPTYDHVKEGASHEPRFKSTVWVNNQSYESAPGFPTLRSAEHAAAKVALDSLQKSQTSGPVPSSVVVKTDALQHELGLCKNLLQEFAQKNGYLLPQYKIMRQLEEHSLVFSATVEIAGVSYCGGGAKSKKEAEIKAARTALLAIEASQPAAGVGLPAVEPRPLVQRKKRGRANPLLEEPLATRMKPCLGQVGGLVQLPQMHQMHQMHQIPQVFQVTHILHPPPMNQLAQTFPVSTVGYSGQNVMPVEWNQELGVCTRPAVAFSEPMQVGNIVPQVESKDSQVSNIIPPETTNFVSKDHTESLVTQVHVPSVSTSEALSVRPQFSAAVKQEITASQVAQVSVPTADITPKTPVSATPHGSVVAHEAVKFANGELQAEILGAMNGGVKAVSSEAA